MDFIMLDLRLTDSEEGVVPKARAKSAEEWAKHREVRGYKITPDEIRIEAKCTHPAIQRGLIEWCDYLYSERRDCRLIVQDNQHEIAEKYRYNRVRLAKLQISKLYDRLFLWQDPLA